jgi:hypothetical protein
MELLYVLQRKSVILPMGGEIQVTTHFVLQLPYCVIKTILAVPATQAVTVSGLKSDLHSPN